MTDSAQEQTLQAERQMQQQKWQKFADVLRNSVETEQNYGGGIGERVIFENGQQQSAFDSANGLKSPVSSDEQQSDFTDLAVDDSSNGVAEDGFEVVVNNKRNRSLKQKQINGNVWNGAATHLKELHSSSSSSATAPHSTNSSTQSSKLWVNSATAPPNSKTAQNKPLKSSPCKPNSLTLIQYF